MPAITRIVVIYDDGSEQVITPCPSSPPTPDTLRLALTTTDLRVRQAVGTNAPVICTLPQGTGVALASSTVKEGQYTWGAISAPCSGFCAVDYLKIISDTNPNLLIVPWVSQLTSTSASPNDCGQACVLMLWRWQNPLQMDKYTVDKLSSLEYSYTSADELVALGARLDPPVNLRAHAHSFDDWQNEWNEGWYVPSIWLVDYKMLPFPSHLVGGTDQGTHWLVVVGADADSGFIWVHDPLWTPSQNNKQGGAFLQLTVEQFARAVIWGTRNVVELS